MKKVKCLYNSDVIFVTITPGKIYDVISVGTSNSILENTILIKNDYNNENVYNITMFTDVTHEYRNEVIDNILR